MILGERGGLRKRGTLGGKKGARAVGGIRSAIWLVLFAMITALAMPAGRVQAQHITVDGRLAPARTLTGPNYLIGADLGKQVGPSLFHSFRRFGLSPSETATFSGPGSVNNVIGRVTGGSPSSIEGMIRSTIPGANLGSEHGSAFYAR
jgi:hypothetical protein